ncbi:MAG: hypothetical protein K0R08_2276, partial [Solimicrobium sp.]|nr:hypothetical protein [Solimicrobium sp.]
KDSKIELHHLMVFVKDNNYVFKNKLPLEFKQLLAGLSEAKRGAILNEFAPDSRHIMCAYLGDATGQDWSTHIEEVKDSVTVDSQEIKENFIILEQIHNAKNLKDVRWKYDIQNSPHSYIADGCRRYKMPVETLIAKLNTLDYDSYKLAEPVHAQAPSFLKPSNNQPFYPVDKDKVFYALFSKSEL